MVVVVVVMIDVVRTSRLYPHVQSLLLQTCFPQLPPRAQLQLGLSHASGIASFCACREQGVWNRRSVPPSRCWATRAQNNHGNPSRTTGSIPSDSSSASVARTSDTDQPIHAAGQTFVRWTSPPAAGTFAWFCVRLSEREVTDHRPRGVFAYGSP